MGCCVNGKVNPNYPKNSYSSNNNSNSKSLKKEEKEVKIKIPSPNFLTDSNNETSNLKREEIEAAMKRKKYNDIKITTEQFIKENIRKVEEDYRILSIIGKGSYGSIYKVQHKTSGLFRAMKVIKKTNLITEEDENYKFIKEIEILMKVDHPHILKIFEYYTDSVNFMLITEYIGGGDLYSAITKFKKFSEENVAEIMYQLLSAVCYLHSINIVHRDIKPENILVETWSLKKNDISIKIIDFGTSNYFSSKNKLSLRIGSPYYIAPEVLKDFYDEKCDIWSCGILMFILLTGKPPFSGKTSTQIMNNVTNGNMQNIEEGIANLDPITKKLISSLLERDSVKRISAEKALNSEWITSFREKELSKIDRSDYLDVFNTIKNFTSKEKLQQATLAYIVHFIGATDEVKKLKKIFKALDSSGDGRLTYYELRSGFEKIVGKTITDVEMQKIALDIDQDQNGFIEYEEFLRVALNKNTLLSKENLKLAFDNFDKNGDGTLSAEEIKEVLGTKNNEYFSELIEKIDQNNDGVISLNEFSDLMIEILNDKVPNHSESINALNTTATQTINNK
jgi:calcium-dependent protein kinase